MDKLLKDLLNRRKKSNIKWEKKKTRGFVLVL